METFFKELKKEEWKKHISFFEKRGNKEVVEKLQKREGILFKSASKLNLEYKYYIDNNVYIFANPASKQDAIFYLYKYPDSYEGREVNFLFDNSYFHQVMYSCGYKRTNGMYKIRLSKREVIDEIEKKLSKTRRNWKIGISIVCILWVFLIGIYVCLKYIYVSYPKADFTELSKEDQSVIKKFYEIHPEMVSKGELFDLKFYSYNKNNMQGNSILTIKKTSKRVDFKAQVFVKEEGNYVSLDQDVRVDSLFIRFMNDNIGFLDFESASFPSELWKSYDISELMRVEDISEKLKDIKIAITYPGGSENHYLKVDQNKVYQIHDQYGFEETSYDKLNMLYDLDETKWLEEVKSYINENPSYEYLELFRNVYTDRQISKNSARYVYEIVKDKILKDEFYEANENKNISMERLSFPLIYLYPLIEDAQGKKEILMHISEWLSSVTSGSNFTLDKNANTFIRDEETITLMRETYFQLLYLTDKNKYFKELFSMIHKQTETNEEFLDMQGYLSCILNDYNLTVDEAVLVYEHLGGCLPTNYSYTSRIYQKCKEAYPNLPRMKELEWFEEYEN